MVDAATPAEAELLAPEQVAVPDGWALAGNAFAAYGERLPRAAARHAVLPHRRPRCCGWRRRCWRPAAPVAPAEAWPLLRSR